MQIGGTARKPVVRLISDPELPDAEKLSWLILGHAPDNLGAGDASVLLAAAGGLLGNDSVNLVQQLKLSGAGDDTFIGDPADNQLDAGSNTATTTTIRGATATDPGWGGDWLTILKSMQRWLGLACATLHRM